MNSGASEEHAALRDTVRRVLQDGSPSAEIRRVMAGPTGFDADVWATLAKLGLTGITVPTEYGGAGFTAVELAIVFEEMGRALLPAPYLSGVVAAAAILASGDENAARAALPGIAAGTALATTTLTSPDPPPDAERDGDGYRLSGTAPYVLDGHIADAVVVVGSTERGPSLFSVSGEPPGLTRTPLTTLDQTRRLARLEFDRVPATLVGGDGAARPAIDAALDLAAVALSAEQVGGAARCLEMAVEYAKVRVQFGRPIGSFQAIKHRFADLLVDVESARSAACHAATLAAEASPDLHVYASLAKAYCSEVYTRVAEENIQIHGGIGFTWEHDAHLYLKRAKSGEALFGSPASHRARLASVIGI